jgi:hypothetical protein
MTPEDRAKAVVAYFPGIPPKIRSQVEQIVSRAIKRALDQQLAELEREAIAARRFAGRGKRSKDTLEAEQYYHTQWAYELRKLRTGEENPLRRDWRDVDLARIRRDAERRAQERKGNGEQGNAVSERAAGAGG